MSIYLPARVSCDKCARLGEHFDTLPDDAKTGLYCNRCRYRKDHPTFDWAALDYEEDA